MEQGDVVDRLKSISSSNNLVDLVSVTPNAEEIISYCARVSSPHNQTNFDTSAKLLAYCIKNRHWSVFETANLTLQIKTSRAISAQILRHRSFTMQEFSQRYAAIDESGVTIYAARRQDDKNRQNSVDDLPAQIREEWEQRQRDNWRDSFAHYTWALDNGIAKECARFVLPLSTSTTIYMTGNVRSRIHYIELRSAHGTQKEHMDIAIECKAIFVQLFPEISKALGW